MSNPYHKPAGTSEGGEFTSAPGDQQHSKDAKRHMRGAIAQFKRNADGDYEISVEGKNIGTAVKAYLRLEGPSYVFNSSNSANRGFKRLSDLKAFIAKHGANS